MNFGLWGVHWICMLAVCMQMPRVSALTAEVKMDSCYDTTRRGYGFRVSNGPIVSRVNCTMYFEAPDPDLYMIVRLNSVNLQRIGSSCPIFIVYVFSTWRTDPVPDEWRGSEVSVPADPYPLLSCNCTNYLDKCSNMPFDETKGPNQKIMLSYNPDDPKRTVKREGAFDVTISSYLRGASFNCPTGYFSCWHYKYRCMPTNLVCDGYDNCYDNSDEFDYSCTGRIANMTLPVFIIMVLACVVVFSILVFIGICIGKRHLRRRRLDRNEWGEVVKTGEAQNPYAPMKSDPRATDSLEQEFAAPGTSSMPTGFDYSGDRPMM